MGEWDYEVAEVGETEELTERDLKMLESLEDQIKDDVPDEPENVDLSGVTHNEGEVAESSEDTDNAPGNDSEAQNGDNPSDGSQDEETPQNGSENGASEGDSKEGEGSEQEGDDKEGEQGEEKQEKDEQGQESEEGESKNEEEGDGNDEENSDEKNESDEKPECDGNCEQTDEKKDDDEECEYCRDREEARNKNDGTAIAHDKNGREIYVGTEVQHPKLGFIGFALGLNKEPAIPGEDMQKRLLVLKRRDDHRRYNFCTKEGVFGYGVIADEVEVLPQPEEKEEEQEEKQEEKQQEQMTEEQHSKFRWHASRLFANTERIFGKTLEEKEVEEIEEGGVFYDEEVSRSMSIESRGVTYRITITAQRYE